MYSTGLHNFLPHYDVEQREYFSTELGQDTETA
jgi:hypothetical protein